MSGAPPPPDDWAAVVPPRGLRAASVEGAAVNIASQLARFAIQIGGLWFLARLLPPRDFGLVGMVTALTGLVAIFKDLGLATATVQRERVTREQVATLFWFNVTVGAIVALAVAALSPAIAWFYREPSLLGIGVALSAGFFLGGLAVQHLALLRREMRFGAIAAVDVTAQATGVAAALGAAWWGAGYWSLVAQQLVVAAATAGGALLAGGWWPAAPRRGSGVRPMLRFGGYLTAFNVVNYLARNLDNVLLGRVWGAHVVGIYARAYSLMTMPLNQIGGPVSAVALPSMSRLQAEPERFRRYYLESVRLVALGSMPVVGLLFALSREIVLVVLGPAWIEAAEIFSYLAIAAFIQPVLGSLGNVYVALGQTDRLARWGIAFAAARVASFVIGVPWGARGVAIAFAAGTWILAPLSLWAACRLSPVRAREIVATALRPAALGFAAGGTAFAAKWAVADFPPLATVALGLAAAFAALALLAALWPAVRRDVRGVLGLLRELRPGSRASRTESLP